MASFSRRRCDRLGGEAGLGGEGSATASRAAVHLVEQPLAAGAPRGRAARSCRRRPSRSTRSADPHAARRGSSSARIRAPPLRRRASVSRPRRTTRHRHRPATTRSPSTAAPADQLAAARPGRCAGSSVWLMTNSQDRPSSPTRRATSTPGRRRRGSGRRRPRRAAARRGGRCRPASSRRGDVPRGARRRRRAGSPPGRPAAGPSAYDATASAPAACELLGPQVGGGRRRRAVTSHRLAVSRGRNSSSRTPSRSRNAPG